MGECQHHRDHAGVCILCLRDEHGNTPYDRRTRVRHWFRSRWSRLRYR